MVGQLAVEVLKCRKDCVEKMGNFRSDQREDLFGSIFHYLQQGYHHCKFVCVFVRIGLCVCLNGYGEELWGT